LSLGLLAGPTIAYFTLKSLRAISVVYGITAMLMGGLLVHFGQGPVQIEMHFYFFALLAMLCMFANPAVNIVAAVTVALHHGVLWFLAPRSVFNYDAEFWVVGVHAAFVILETVAACFISRQFFDNVIGLEKIVEARTEELREKQRDMRLILDNVEQGLVTVDLEGRMSSECSLAAQKWFGKAEAGGKLAGYVHEKDAKFAEWFELALESVKDGMLPAEVTLAQMPARLTANGRSFAVSYQPIGGGETPEKVLVIFTDVTERLNKEAAERHQKELLDLFGHIMKDKLGFVEFLSETNQIMDILKEERHSDLAHMKRLVHTVKGNASLFSMRRISEICHDLENKIAEEGVEPGAEELAGLTAAWEQMCRDLDQFLGERRQPNIEVRDADYETILRAVLDPAIDRGVVAKVIASWRLEPTARRLSLVQEQIKGLAQRMGKDGIVVEVEPYDLRLENRHFAPFWSSFVHVLRNAVDHGIENEEERERMGKKGPGRIRVTTAIEGESFVITVQDDGRGIDWDALQAKARQLGLDHAAGKDRDELVFMDGVSTKETVTFFSGRGVGMGSVREACLALGGKIELHSEPGDGTTVRFVFPNDERVYAGHSAVLAGAKAA
jgi:two-component system chemotaxis sensor kinase CheA